MNDSLWIWVLFAVGLYFLATALVFFFQRRLMYFPNLERPTPEVSGDPEMKEVSIQTEDNLSLLAWYRPPVKKEMPTLIYFPGNAGHLGMRAYKVKPYLDFGFGVLLTTWRGFSGNSGKPSEEGLYRDGRAALDYVQNNSFHPANLILYGESLGTGVAVHLALEQPPVALVLEAPFSSACDVAKIRLPLFPVRSLIFDRFESDKKISSIVAPILIVHGAKDKTIPIRLARKLFTFAKQPKSMHVFNSAGHNDLYHHGMDNIVLKFINELF